MKLTCLSCGAETSNGLVLCDLCRHKAATDLDFIPVYFHNLSRWRPGRAGSRQVPGSRVLWDGTTRDSGTGDRISDALDAAANALLTWARLLVEDREFVRPLTMADAVLTGDLPDALAEHLNDHQDEAVAWLCAGLKHHLVSIATREWCGEFMRSHHPGENEDHEIECDGIGYHERRLRILTETAMPGWYAGACRRKVTMDQTCGAPTYVIPGLTWVTCTACGSTTYAHDHLDIILEEARDWVARPMRLAEAIVAMVDTEQSVPRLHKRISKWGEREQIEVIREADHLPKRYRLGEVLDVLFAEGQTRLVDHVAVKVG